MKMKKESQYFSNRHAGRPKLPTKEHRKCLTASVSPEAQKIVSDEIERTGKGLSAVIDAKILGVTLPNRSV